MPELNDESVHLVVTSPPYANLKEYEPGNPSQLGDIDDYEKFLDELEKVWAECFRVLVPGGRICCVVGDVNIARSKAGRHYVLPLASDLRVRGRHLGFDHLQGILWYKVANIKLEASKSSRFLGKPNLPEGGHGGPRCHHLLESGAGFGSSVSIRREGVQPRGDVRTLEHRGSHRRLNVRGRRARVVGGGLGRQLGE